MSHSKITALNIPVSKPALLSHYWVTTWEGKSFHLAMAQLDFLSFQWITKATDCTGLMISTSRPSTRCQSNANRLATEDTCWITWVSLCPVVSYSRTYLPGMEDWASVCFLWNCTFLTWPRFRSASRFRPGPILSWANLISAIPSLYAEASSEPGARLWLVFGWCTRLPSAAPKICSVGCSPFLLLDSMNLKVFDDSMILSACTAVRHVHC